MWLAFFYQKACSNNAADLALPKHFRAILYLDVFGGFERTLGHGARGAARSTLSTIVDGVQNLQQFNPFRGTDEVQLESSVSLSELTEGNGVSVSERSTPLLEEEERSGEAADSTG